MMTNTRKILWGIIILSFIIPLFYSFYHRIHPVVDAQAYDQIAMNLLAGNGFKEDPDKSVAFDTAIVRAGPGYEFFLAGLYKIFGHHYEAVWIWQALLHALSAWMLFLLAKEIFKDRGEKIGLFSAGIFGLHPDLIEISAMLMTETVYLFLIILAVWIFAQVYNLKGLWWSVGLGLVTGLGILFRPPVVLFIPVFLFFYYTRKKYVGAFLFLFFLVLILAPWTYRNYFHFRQIIPTTMIGSYNIWIGNTLNSVGGQIAGGFNPVTTYTEVNGFTGLPTEAKKQFRNFIWEHPEKFLNLTSVRFVRYFSLIRPMGFWFYQTGWPQLIFVSLSALFIAVLFVLGLAGLALLFFERHPWRYYLLTLALTSPIVLLPTVVQARYRFQVYPFFALALGYFIVLFLEKNKYAKKVFWISFGSLLVITLLDLSRFWSTVTERLNNFF